MKKILIVLAIIVIAIIIFFLLKKPDERPFNLSDPQKQAVKIDDKNYSLDVQKYTPHYVISKLLSGKEKVDYSTPEATYLAVLSAWGRDVDWYLSLLDESKKNKIKAMDKKAGGKALQEFNKDKLLDILKEGNQTELLYKVTIEINGKTYAIIKKVDYHSGQKDQIASTEVFKKNGDAWLNSYDLTKHPIKHLVGLNTYEKMKEICETGGWKDPIEHDGGPAEKQQKK